MRFTTCTSDIHDDDGRVLLPAGTLLIAAGDEYVGVNPDTGKKIRIHVSIITDPQVAPYFKEEHA